MKRTRTVSKPIKKIEPKFEKTQEKIEKPESKTEDVSKEKTGK